ncbi:MAG TPA: hypothetical protein VGD34_01975 [Kribbella sp.]|jgi:hypothetical protein
MIDEARLGTYLQDHYAGSVAGSELFKRAAEQQSDPAVRAALARMVEKVEAERSTLEGFLRAIGSKPDPVKNAGAWVVEKLGRFKPNGELIRRSPLSDIVELEGLRLAVEGKAAGWRVLRRLADDDERLSAKELDDLIADAQKQTDELEGFRMDSAVKVFLRQQP